MPWPRPTLTQLRQRIRAKINSLLPQASALLRFSNMYIIGEVQAGEEHELYGYLDFIAREAVPFTATDEYLVAWAALVGIVREPATPAAGNFAFGC